MAHLFIFFLLLINVHPLQAQTCESLFEETSVLSRLSLEDQNILTQFARKQVEVSINYSISREQKESILRHIEDQLEYFIETKGLSSYEELILRREYRSLIFQVQKESADIIALQSSKEIKKQNDIKDQKKAHEDSIRIRNDQISHLTSSYGASSLNAVVFKIASNIFHKNNFNDLKLALELGANIEHKNSSGETALHLAASNGALEIAKILVENNADIFAKDNNSSTPILNAIKRDQPDIFKIFLTKIKDINQNDGNLISSATYFKKAEIIEILVANSADVNIKHLGSNPLHVAVQGGNPDIVRLLIKLGANLDEVNQAGESALHIAAKLGDARITKILIENNININIRNNEGQTALELIESQRPIKVGHIVAQHETIALIKGATK